MTYTAANFTKVSLTEKELEHTKMASLTLARPGLKARDMES